MLAGWREMGLARAVVVDPSPAARGLVGAGVEVVGSAAEVPVDFVPGAVVLAVKPQVAAAVLPDFVRLAAGAVVISIMAGKNLAFLSGILGPVVVRAMPNTPAAVRQGFTVAVAGDAVSAAQRDLAGLLLGAVGDLAWVADEGLLDAVTAVSGGGPAYVFLLTELMEREAVAQGIPADLARRLARRTVVGSAALLAAGDEDAAALRVAVTSPGGTTEQALRHLQAGWPEVFAQAIQAATERSRALSQG
jgi:pyrroline-5-carboxylate reductase